MKAKSKWSVLVTVLAVLSLLSFSLSSSEKREPTPESPDFPRYVLNKVDDLYRGDKSFGTMSMKVKTKHWTRSMQMESWSMGKDYSLVRILKPKKEKGTSTLKAKDDLYIYLKKTDKTIKITSGMMGGSWMGSHFTNDDLVRHTRLSEDYNITLDPIRELNGVKVWKFNCIPKPNAPVVWGKLEVVVRQADLLPVNQVYYDEDGAKVRILEFSDYKEMGGRKLPAKMTMRPLDGSDEFTQVITESIDFTVKLNKSFFSIHKLRS